MTCPHCQHEESAVIETRVTGEGVRRRRQCAGCRTRFTTYERVEAPAVTVIKKNGNEERFSPEKVRRGVRTCCKGRPVTDVMIDAIVAAVTREVLFGGQARFSSVEIGDLVGDQLKEVDRVAYVRFASVYRGFNGPEEFTEILTQLKNA